MRRPWPSIRCVSPSKLVDHCELSTYTILLRLAIDYGAFKRFLATLRGQQYIKLHALDNDIFERDLLNIQRLWRGYALRKSMRDRRQK